MVCLNPPSYFQNHWPKEFSTCIFCLRAILSKIRAKAPTALVLWQALFKAPGAGSAHLPALPWWHRDTQCHLPKSQPCVEASSSDYRLLRPTLLPMEERPWKKEMKTPLLNSAFIVLGNLSRLSGSKREGVVRQSCKTTKPGGSDSTAGRDRHFVCSSCPPVLWWTV